MGLLRRWRAKHLLLAWVLYWIVLVVVALRPAIAMILRAINAPKGLGSISASVADGMATLTVLATGQTWTGTASLTSLALWLAGPPLLLWLVWLVTRRSPAAAHERDFRIS
jgi:hypothetical protein